MVGKGPYSSTKYHQKLPDGPLLRHPTTVRRAIFCISPPGEMGSVHAGSIAGWTTVVGYDPTWPDHGTWFAQPTSEHPMFDQARTPAAREPPS